MPLVETWIRENTLSLHNPCPQPPSPQSTSKSYLLNKLNLLITRKSYINYENWIIPPQNETLLEAKNEWKHVIPYKLSQESLKYFVIGYNLQEKLVADIVTVWPSYQGRRDQYFVLIGNNNCFVKWIELLPNSIQEIIDNGVKAKI